jgi:hypothetical protein
MHWCAINSKTKDTLIEGKDYSFKDASGFVHTCKYVDGHIVNRVTKEQINHIVSIWQ